MMRIVFSRLFQAGLLVLGVGTLTFIVSRSLDGDIAYRIAAGRYGDEYVNALVTAAVREELGLDRAAWVQYLDWLFQLLRWDLGYSLVTGRAVLDTLAHEFKQTLSLAAAALGLSLLIGPPLGLWAGLAKRRFVDAFTLAAAAITRSMPAYAIGAMLIILFSVHLDWLPSAGYGALHYYLLPALTLALGMAVVSARVTRNATVAVIQSPYYEFAQLKGLPPFWSFVRHGLRNLSIPVIAYHGVQFIYLVEGVVVVETLFAWPGIGHSLVHAIVNRDIPMIQGTAMVLAFTFVLLNTLLDLLYHWIDPRERIV